ncbi:MAG: 16S rRNA (adenine(1518)-N(6)/adenine(1519)-N(6))-dimethyltransferase RsmA [Candidatus Bipolaricaulia bacterium]
MSSPRAVRDALAQLGIRPRKRWGQHFLIDANTVERIISVAEPAAADTVLEIGPGLGVLTERLAEVTDQVVAVEVDPTLAAWLSERFRAEPHVQIVQADALEAGWPEILPSNGDVQALGNLPYNITAPLLERLIQHRDRVRSAVWTVQREVATKLLADPGTRETSSLGIWVQAQCHVERAFNVSKNAFYPPPEVESAVLAIEPRAKPAFSAPDWAFQQAVRAAFGVRRKTLRRALSLGLDISTDESARLLQNAGIDEHRRGETLTMGEFDRLAQALASTSAPDAASTEAERGDTPPSA